MNIIQEKWNFLHTTVPFVPKQLRTLYGFGLQALSVRPVMSLRANARLLGLNWFTAKSKVYRLVTNVRFLVVFPTLVDHLHLVGPKDMVAVDFSDFGNNHQVLLFAKQTKRGRTVPLYFEILTYPIVKDSQNTFIIDAIKQFAATVGCRPMLVFDRGFACPAIIRFLNKNGYRFIIRLKGGKLVVDPLTRQRFLARTLPDNDRIVLAYDCRLRVVVSDDPGNGNEPWYLITNDTIAKRDRIIDRYYHRFEIEEFFRDAKRLLGLEGLRCQKATSLAAALWFVLLGFWFLDHVQTMLDAAAERTRRLMGLSRNRYLLEMFQRQVIAAAERPFFANHML